MKKSLFALLLVVLLCFAACGGKTAPVTTNAPDTDPATTDAADVSDQTTEAPEETAAPADEPLVTIDGLNLTVRNDGKGEDGSSNGLDKVIFVHNDNVGFSTEVGPMKLSIDQIQLANVTCQTDATASFLGVEQGVAFAMVVMDITVENTSDKDMSWYPNQSVIVTNMKEQITAELMLCDDVGGDFYGEVIKTGQVYFVIPSSTADQISHIQWRIDSPHDSNLDHYGEDLMIEIDLVK